MPSKRATEKPKTTRPAEKPKTEKPSSVPRRPATDLELPIPAVVGMGASAGGLEAFTTFFQNMPPDCGMAFVVVSHLDPHHESVLAEILSKHTKMTVEQVRRRAPVMPNHVYVMPPNAPLTIEQGVLVLRGTASKAPRTPIDHFFRSLAEDQGERAVCIVLSGTGSDGTLGVRMVKEHGGLTIAQEVSTARYDSMPRSAISTGMVDQVLTVDAMPSKLLEYVRHLDHLAKHKDEYVLAWDGGNHLIRIVGLLKKETGHDFSLYKKSTLIRRIQRRMQVMQSGSVEAYVEQLEKDGKEVELLFRDLLIGVTQFFRDPEAFKVLAREVIPRIFARRGADDQVRVWVSACATGEEAYSIAILIAEHIATLRVVPRVQIFATDIDDQALEVARQARYPEGIADQISSERLERFFRKDGHEYRLAKSVRELVIFSRHNLTKDPPFSKVDLICCRNLLIYLESELQKRLTALYHYALGPGGFLFLGSSENLAGPAGHFSVIDKKHRIFQRKPVVVPQMPGIPFGDFARARSALDRTPPVRKEVNLFAALERILVEQYAPASVVVDENGNAVYFCGNTGRYLGPSSGAPTTSVVSMARKGLRLDLRSALHKAVRDKKQVVFERVSVHTDGGVHRINLTVRPLTELGEEANLFLVVFQDLPEIRKGEHSTSPPSASEGRMVQQLEDELRSTRGHLQTTVEELETSNEELMSSNEELMSMNEEFMSSNEELQTSREELQSVNEELQTVNAELGAKVEELDAVNSDLQNLLQSSQIPTVFLSHDLRINRFTIAATDVFSLIESDVGRPITDITSRIADHGLEADFRQVLRTLVPRERQVRLLDCEGCFLMRVSPYRTPSNVIEGVVVTFVDVTELERSRAQAAQFAAIVDSTADAVFTKTLACQITTWNTGAERMYGWSAAEAIGRSVAILVPPELNGQPEEIVARLLRGEEVAGMETVRVRKDGTRLDVSLTCSVVREQSGELSFVSVIARDITARKLGELELVRANDALRHTNEDLQQLAYATSHDLQEPLRMISNYAQLLARSAEKSLDERAKGFLNNIIGGSARLGLLLRALQDYWSVDHRGLELAPIDANTVIEMVVRNLKLAIDESEARITWDPLPTLNLHQTPLLQLFQNLLDNSLKYRKEGVPPVVHVSARRVDHMWEFSVADNGVAVPEKHRDQIFHPFRRLHGEHFPGVGMGLAICARIVAFFGGRIWVDGNGDGATFKFTFPAEEPE